MKFFRICILIVSAATLLSTTASATIFSDSALFDAANPGLTVLDFEGIAPVNDFIEPTPQPWATDVLFTDPGDTSSVAISDSGFFFATPTDALFVDLFNAALLGTFSTAVGAVGFDIAIGFGGLGATVELFDLIGGSLDSVAFDTAIETVFTSFIGFSGLGEIGSVRITPDSGGFVLIDNFRFGAAAVPEPATLALFGLGLAGLGFARRKKA